MVSVCLSVCVCLCLSVRLSVEMLLLFYTCVLFLRVHFFFNVDLRVKLLALHLDLLFVELLLLLELLLLDECDLCS